METFNKKRINYPFFIFLLLVSWYVGYCISKLDFSMLRLDNLREQLIFAVLHPLPVTVTEYTFPALGAASVIWVLVLLSEMSKQKNYMPGREYGTARIAKPEEINRKMADPNPRLNKIISEHLRISTNTRLTGINNNVLIIGGSGAGKSFFIVKPNGYNCTSSFIFCDPKGELLRDIGNYLKAQGYRIIVLNLVDMDQSDGYNPFAYIRSAEDIVKLITNLIANTTPKNSSSGDPFWEKSESMFLQALMLYVWIEYPKQGKPANFRGLMELLNKAKIPEKETDLSDLDKLMYELPEDHPALVTYRKVRGGAADTVRSIIISAHARLAYLQNEKILKILDKDEMDIPFLGEGVYGNPERKTAVFCVIPDMDKSYNFVVGLFYTQVFQELYFIADHKYGGRLPVPVAFWMDEFANTALPDSFCELLSTMRSREISCNIIIQTLAQLKVLFKDSWETITGNCDIQIYLGGNDLSVHKHMSEMLGKTTIDKKSTGESLGSHGSSSRNYDVLGRDLAAPDEVRKMDNKKCMVFVRGFDPVIDDKYRTYEKEEFKIANQMGPYVHHSSRKDLEEGQINYYIFNKNKEKSFRYQLHQYMGIFEESLVFQECKTYEDYLYLPEELFVGYVYEKDTKEKHLVYPAFDAGKAEMIESGGASMKKHAVIGYLDQGELIRVDMETIKTIFMEVNICSPMLAATM